MTREKDKSRKPTGDTSRFGTKSPYNKPYFWQSTPVSEKETFYEEYIKPIADLSLVVAPFITAYIGNEISGFGGLVIGVLLGLIYDLSYVSHSYKND